MRNYICDSQTEYFDLLNKYKFIVNSDITLNQICIILNEIELFWHKRLDIIEKELDIFTKTDYCMFLAGSTYLCVEENDHYVYRGLGNHHFLDDGLIRISATFMICNDGSDISKSRGLFIRTFNDQLSVLKNFKNAFLYLPLTILHHRADKEIMTIMQKAFFDVISDLFKHDFTTQNEFCERYHNYEEIEKDLGENIRSLVFTEYDDTKQTLRYRIKNFCKSQADINLMIDVNDEPKLFLFIIFSFISQVLDILLESLYFKLTPFIRYEVTFHYFMLLNGNLNKEPELRIKIENTLITYIFYHYFDRTTFSDLDFAEYVTQIHDLDLFTAIHDKMKKDNIAFTGGSINNIIKKVQQTIDSSFLKKYGYKSER